jgi:aspartyl-tRNA(Asn)/glutamyl-tRNA(Gln) amidotransferase subunit A
LITLKEALSLASDDIKKLRDDLTSKIKESNVGAYVEQLISSEISQSGSGIPIAIKDNINVKNWEITCSSNILKGYVSPYNATVINKLEKAGLSPFGRTNMDEFAMGSSTESSCYGRTLNPVDNSKIPGGSSGGTGAFSGTGRLNNI